MKGIVYVNLPDSQPVYLDFPPPVGRVILSLDRRRRDKPRLRVDVTGHWEKRVEEGVSIVTVEVEE